tara:strand:+ start:28 stop:1101 length:1074 start_codon:yes stop_codon:yes gene_type:complete
MSQFENSEVENLAKIYNISPNDVKNEGIITKSELFNIIIKSYIENNPNYKNTYESKDINMQQAGTKFNQVKDYKKYFSSESAFKFVLQKNMLFDVLQAINQGQFEKKISTKDVQKFLKLKLQSNPQYLIEKCREINKIVSSISNNCIYSEYIQKQKPLISHQLTSSQLDKLFIQFSKIFANKTTLKEAIMKNVLSDIITDYQNRLINTKITSKLLKDYISLKLDKNPNYLIERCNQINKVVSPQTNDCISPNYRYQMPQMPQMPMLQKENKFPKEFNSYTAYKMALNNNLVLEIVNQLKKINRKITINDVKYYIQYLLKNSPQYLIQKCKEVNKLVNSNTGNCISPNMPNIYLPKTL